jgi:hypothetical protein
MYLLSYHPITLINAYSFIKFHNWRLLPFQQFSNLLVVICIGTYQTTTCLVPTTSVATSTGTTQVTSGSTSGTTGTTGTSTLLLLPLTPYLLSSSEEFLPHVSHSLFSLRPSPSFYYYFGISNQYHGRDPKAPCRRFLAWTPNQHRIRYVCLWFFIIFIIIF